MLRDHIQSDKLGDACKRVHYGFRRECELFLRTVLEKSPHKEVQGLANLRLAQFLEHRRMRLELLKDQPEMAKRYEGLFGIAYLDLRPTLQAGLADGQRLYFAIDGHWTATGHELAARTLARSGLVPGQP